MHPAAHTQQGNPTVPSHDTPIVFVVDDDISVRESLECLIRCSGWQTETFASAEEFLAHPRAHVPSCLILDYRLPLLDGLGLQKRLAASDGYMPIIFMSCFGDLTMAVQAMKAGAIEMLCKPFRDDEMIDAIHQGIGRSRTALMRQRETHQLRQRYETLSPRERETMWMVVAGHLNKQIASEMKISEITVKAHRASAKRKMKAKSLAELVSMAIKLDRATLPDA